MMQQVSNKKRSAVFSLRTPKPRELSLRSPKPREQSQDLDPRTRWSPRQAAQHPFVTNKRFTAPFQPPPDPHVPLRMPEVGAGSAPGIASSPYGGERGKYAGYGGYAPPMAAAMATSPEAHATAHAAALAALQARPVRTEKNRDVYEADVRALRKNMC